MHCFVRFCRGNTIPVSRSAVLGQRHLLLQVARLGYHRLLHSDAHIKVRPVTFASIADHFARGVRIGHERPSSSSFRKFTTGVEKSANLGTKKDVITCVEVAPRSYYDLSFSSGDATTSDALAFPLPRQSELPELPALPESWRYTPHLSSTDIHTYARPLIGRGWRIIPAGDSPETGLTLAMASDYQFSKYKTAREFLNLLCDMSSEEKHHARITLDHKTVSVQLQTHTAHVAGTDSAGNRVVYKISGLTTRDIRWATRCEQIRTDMADTAAVQISQEDLISTQRQSLKYLLWRYGGETKLIPSQPS